MEKTPQNRYSITAKGAAFLAAVDAGLVDGTETGVDKFEKFWWMWLCPAAAILRSSGSCGSSQPNKRGSNQVRKAPRTTPKRVQAVSLRYCLAASLVRCCASCASSSFRRTYSLPFSVMA